MAMFVKDFKWHLVCFIAIILSRQDGDCFFVKHADSGLCFFASDNSYQTKPARWGQHFYLELSKECFAPAAQFSYRSNGAILSTEKKGCLTGYKKGHDHIALFYVYVGLPTLDTSACATKYRRDITQTSGGSLQINWPRAYNPFQSVKRCAVPQSNTKRLSTEAKVGINIGTKTCTDNKNMKFYFGSLTCHGSTTKNVSCHKDQFMVVKTASYRGLPASQTCTGLSDDYICEVDATCRVKKLCDGKNDCSIAVDDNFLPADDPCPRLSKYLYFEYQCVDNEKPFTELCVDSVSLTSSTSPNEGILHVSIDKKDNTVCSEAPIASTEDVVCKQLGYLERESSADSEKTGTATFSGTINCEDDQATLSQCVTRRFTKACPKLSYITCAVCNKPLLEREDYFPDSSFTASDSSEGQNPHHARISSGSSWCAPESNDEHYLQVDLGSRFVLTKVATFGDSSSSKWVTSYHLNYSLDMIHWKQAYWKKSSTERQKIFRGNTNAYNNAAIRPVNNNVDNNVEARALRFIPLDSVAQPCMRVQICGDSVLPGRPSNLTVDKTMSKNAEVSWLDPKFPTTQKTVTKFRIIWKQDKKIIQNKTRDRGNNFGLKDLKPFTKYEVFVSVGNANGFGKSTSVEFMTDEAAPEGPPLNLEVTAENSSSLSVTWEPPEKDKRNGKIVNYHVCVSHEESKSCFKKYTTEKQMIIISNLNAATKYYVRVLASTKVGPGNYSESKGIFTNGKAPNKLSNGTSSTLSFTLQTPAGNFTHFYVVALKLSDGKTPKSPDRFKNDELVTYTEALESTNPKPYIAAVFTPGSLKGNMFVLGDGRNTSDPTARRRRSTSSGYYNGPLELGTSYSIFQRFFLGGKDEYFSSEWSSPSETSSTTEPSSGGSSMVGAIVGAVIGIILVLIIVTLAFLLYKRRTDMRCAKGTEKNNDTADQEIVTIMNTAFETQNNHTADMENNHYQNVDQAECKKSNLPAETVEDVYANQETVIARTHCPIPVAEFDGYVNKMKKNKSNEFKLDFEDLPTGQTLNWDIAREPFNIPKNRFKNAVTYNHSRVVLSGDEKTDYINASYIDGITEKYYIATQGPKPKTVNDFWRMIFELKCPTIAMLTTLKEMGKVKCEKYWPDESGIYGEIKVTATKSREFADYVTRTFIVEKGNDQIEVKQFHFVSWPDYGVPQYPTQLLTFRRYFKSYHVTKTGPAVIHCSAGVGRTGVFIAVDRILDDLDKEKKETIDIFGVVKDMRTSRINMVQTTDQYVFIHDTILDRIKCGTNEVEATQLMIAIKSLSEKDKKGKTGFEETFKRLNGVSPKIVKDHCETALMSENKKKNRNPEICPSETDRVYLHYLEDVANSDYINACFVDGYLGKHYFIATQTPLKETINDFWRMVLQHNSSTIVTLNELREKGKEYPMFWPTQRARPQSFGPTTVMLDSFVKKEDIVVRKFVVSPSPDIKEGRMVRMIQYMSWPDHGVPENVDDIVKVLSEVDESQRAAEKKGPVTVVCSDGAGRTGTYIAISNLVDRVKVVQVIDVFQCIKLIRSRRPQFVETAAQFRLCYDAITSVLESFNEYSNFSLTDE